MKKIFFSASFRLLKFLYSILFFSFSLKNFLFLPYTKALIFLKYFLGKINLSPFLGIPPNNQ